MKKTIGDYAADTWQNYFARTKEVVGVDTVKSKKFVASEFSPENTKQGYEKIGPQRRREIAQESPLFMKGVKKKSNDSFRAWFNLETLKDRGNPVKADIDAFKAFELRSNYKTKLMEVRKASHIYGDGFLLIDFMNDEGNEIDAPPVDSEGKGLEPWNVKILNSEYITDLKFFNDAYEEKGILHYYYVDKDNNEKWIHPDRIQWIPANLIPGFNLGVSTIDLLRWTLYSKKNIDIAAGNILAWFSHGLLDLDIAEMDEDEKKEYMKVAEKHPSVWVHDNNMKVSVKNPTAINPQPFYDYVVLNIAAAINMPTHVLTGIQMGRVTGAEIGFADYYRDVSDDQELLFTPLITNLYSRILAAKGREWKYRLIWNPIYIDEMAEAKLLDIKITAAAKAKAAGLIDTKEGRLMINKGQVELDINKIIEEPGPPDNPHIPPTRKTNKPKQLKGKEADEADKRRLKMKNSSDDYVSDKVKIIGGLGQEEKDMIERCKTARKEMLARMSEEQKKLGKKIIDEQT